MQFLEQFRLAVFTHQDENNMKLASRLAALLAVTFALSSCATTSQPERPDYTGPDNVQTATGDQLVGKWAVTDLNPYPGSPAQTTLIEYRPDGTVTGAVSPEGEGLEALGNLEFELEGNWVLQADTVTHQNITMNSTREDALGSLVSKLVNSQQGISGQANIFELSDNRIVMVGNDGTAMEYIRQ